MKSKFLRKIRDKISPYRRKQARIHGEFIRQFAIDPDKALKEFKEKHK